MATHSSILAWKIPWTEEPGNPSPWDRKELDTTIRLTHIHSYYPQSFCSDSQVCGGVAQYPGCPAEVK